MNLREMAEQIVAEIERTEGGEYDHSTLLPFLESALREVRDTALEEAAKVVKNEYWAAKGENEPAENWLGNRVRALKQEKGSGE